MTKYTNTTLDTLAIAALGTGVTILTTAEGWEKITAGAVLVLVGAALSFLKYHYRK